ncbi:MerC domain-containing protein [Pacificimonas sp. WHA3]|uniref:MerC domain-containing protein n=1 Tax=Pacificimonas pallii TaxID=2827236 RepID=A0ABS6SGQ3_9SPHN|nr:MerC domain-containing protein [Pacificimonas pallii]MBV7257600.1 MerC domain-containing protein [Pacificimonas pallii]
MFAIGAADRAAVVTSGLCVVHCLAAPLASAALPAFGAALGSEAVHIILATVAIGLAVAVMLRARDARRVSFVVPAMLGCLFLFGGLNAESLAQDETVLTVIGGLFLAAAHIYRLFNHQHEQGNQGEID